MNLNKLFNRTNEPSPKKVEKAGKKNLGIIEGAESRAREGLVSEYGFKQGDIDLITELQDPKKGHLRVEQDERGNDVLSCRYLDHDFEARIGESGSLSLLMDGERQDDNYELRYFLEKLISYADFLKKQKNIPELAMEDLTSERSSNLRWELSGEKRGVAKKAIDDFLSRLS